MYFEIFVCLFAGIFWIVSRFSVKGGILMLIAAVMDYFLYPSAWVSLPFIGVAFVMLSEAFSGD